MGPIIMLALMLAGAPAAAQSRYDHDGAWIYGTIRQERAEERRRERREARREARFYRGDHDHERRRRYHWVEHSRRYYGRRDDEHPATRVYGVVTRKQGFVQREATSHVECFAPIKDQGQAHASESAAQNDAELSWSAKVAATYGALFADFRYAANRSKTCFRATFDESWYGKNREAFVQNFGGSGFKTICSVTANPCQAPTVPIEESRIEQRTGTGDRRAPPAAGEKR